MADTSLKFSHFLRPNLQKGVNYFLWPKSSFLRSKLKSKLLTVCPSRHNWLCWIGPFKPVSVRITRLSSYYCFVPILAV